MRPDALLPALLRSDPARPRITCYDDGTGERIELSARVLANWVAKAANLLQDEFEVGPGSVVALDLPPHWRTLYWALAVWRTGAAVLLPPLGEATSADVAVTTGDRAAAGADSWGGAAVIAVTLAALARRSPVALPAGVLDEAADLATFPDVVEPFDEASDDAPALIVGGEHAAYGMVVVTGGTPGERVHTATTDAGDFLRLALRTYAADGSLVLSIAPDPARLPARLDAEGVSRST
ncbi:MAG: TIGR03089 family protein [Dermatophilaceae bacterium]